MIKYECNSCGKVTEFSSDEWKVECTCGDGWLKPVHAVNAPKLEYNPKLNQARKEAKAIKSDKYWRHIFQCSRCSKTTIQQNYDKSIPCTCGGTQLIKITYDNNRIEYDANTGEPILDSQTSATIDNPVKSIRKKLNLSQKELADIFNTTQQYISQLENNERPISAEIQEWINNN
ncbi:helix-turn-helix domain-containing protein [Dendrosporobacter sp. 1207_IL3150]|uniref:helix-turn-helix domain-containing protein n=1 Tax=Dendrosporobacter sp. 1207_IL3150 TaxID=3084054 RepID=UPI002FDB173C